MTSLAQDLRLALRMLVRRPLVSTVAVLSLAVGIGLSTGVFGLFEAAVLRPLPLREAAALRVVLEPRERGVNHNFTYPGFAAYRDAQQSFTGVAAFATVTAALNRGSASEMIPGELVSGEYFDTLEPRLLRGRGLKSADNVLGAPPVVVLSEFEWRRLFGDASDIGGQSIRLNGVTFDVVGVTGGGFRGMFIGSDARFFAAIAQQPVLRPSGRGPLMTAAGSSWLTVMGRLRPGVSDAQAIAELNAIDHRLAAGPPDTTPTYTLVPGDRGDSPMPAQVASPLRLLLGAALAVLLVSCANVAGLLLARAGDRSRELAVRTALGAGRWRLARLLIVESAVVGAAGMVLGLAAARLVAPLSVPLFAAFGQSVTLDVHLNARLLAFAAGAGLVAILGSSLAPILRNWRGARLTALSDSSRSATASAASIRVRRGLVVAQFALTLALVTTAGLLVRTLANVRSIPTGLDLEHVALVSVDMGAGGLDADRTLEYLARAIDRSMALPGVRAAAFGRVVPLGFGGSRTTITVPGYTPDADEDMEINFNIVSAGYFDALGIELVDGRSVRRDPAQAGATIEVVVNETMAGRYWPDGRAVGRQLYLGDAADGTLLEVVGVARDVKYRNVREDARPSFYYSTVEGTPPRAGVLHVRTTGDPEAMLGTIRRTVAEVNPAVPITSVRTLSDQLSINVNSERVTSIIGVVLGLTALLLSAVGLFGAMATLVTGRTRELGVRLALGAVPSGIGRLVLGDGLRLAAWGGAIGVALAVWLGRLVEAQLYGVSAFDPVSLIAAFALLATVAVVAAWVPARRAARVDPVEALRIE